VHEFTGNDTRLAESLAAALEGVRTAPDLSSEVKLELARTCLNNNLKDGAADVLREVMSNAPNNAAMAKAMAVCEEAGLPDMAQTLAKESRQQVVDLVGQGAAAAKNGDFRGAVDLMVQAVERLPNNPQVVFNAAVATLKCLDNTGWDRNLARQALSLIDNVRRLDPVNPKLPALAGLHQQILVKYNKAPRKTA
jgi:thioredoxin-like negative regulator of GroEL